jgi:Family of unknown function (DUF6114)/zinc-ribbon domain
MADKPTAAFALSLIGGIFMLLGGIALTIGFSFVFGGVGAIIGIIGVIMGLVVLLGAVMLYQKPESHTMWGIIILILSIIALPAAWGFGIGSLLAFIGAILALVYKPAMVGGAMPPPMMSSSMSTGSSPASSMGMTCKNCGATIPAGATRCPSCGANL